MNSQPIKVCVVEDHPGMRSGLTFLLNTHPEFVCNSYACAEEAIAGMKHSQPHVLLMDIDLPGMNGIECTRSIKTHYPEVKVMMCTIFEDSDKIFAALKVGADGYILKKTVGDTLFSAIKELLMGGAPMSTEIASKVVKAFRQPMPESKPELMLTQRENETLDLLAKGYGNKEIAERLFVSVNTIRTHIRHIYEKLQVRNRIEALNKTGRNK